MGRATDERGAVVAGLLRRPRPGAAAALRRRAGGVGPADAVLGVPVLDDAGADAPAALGADAGAGAGRRGAADPAVPAVRGRDGDDALGEERARLARRPRGLPHPVTGRRCRFKHRRPAPWRTAPVLAKLRSRNA